MLCINLKTSGTSIIASEMDLDIAHSEYKPSDAEHKPGVDNTIADALSRQFAPGFDFVLPDCLRPDRELNLPDRGREYFRTLYIKSLAASNKQKS